MTVNVDAAEISKFERMAERWWDPKGDMAPLHAINAARLGYIIRAAAGLAGKRILDVGCGAGILTESLAAKGADALGIDLAGMSIDIAIKHAADNGNNARYRMIGTETLAEEAPASFDVVCCMEMLEHVPDPASIIQACHTLVKPGGQVIFSTINRNPKSFAMAIVGAEYLLRLLPRGTHDYAKLIKPSEMLRWSRAVGLEAVDLTGLRYNPLFRSASLSRDVDVNYMAHFRRLEA